MQLFCPWLLFSGVVFSLFRSNHSPARPSHKFQTKQINLIFFHQETVSAEYNQFPEPMRSLLLWLLDLMADIVTNEAVNKMGAKNMAIVMSPNLYQSSR
jgi:hypothetical protein